MRITTLIENLAYKKDLLAEHGLSFYLETTNRKILFDTGQTRNFIHNAGVLGIDLKAVDAVIISHGHYDHTGGLCAFLKMNNKAVVYVKKEVFALKFHGTTRFIGVTYDPVMDNRIVYVENPIELDEGVYIMPDIPVRNPLDTNFNNFRIKKPYGFIHDEFFDELYMVIRIGNEISVISSCSHRGITNIVDAAINHFGLPVNMIVGGFHIRNCEARQLEVIIMYLERFSVKSIGVCHCTGVEKYAELFCQFKKRVFYNHTGYAIEII